MHIIVAYAEINKKNIKQSDKSEHQRWKISEEIEVLSNHLENHLVEKVERTFKLCRREKVRTSEIYTDKRHMCFLNSPSFFYFHL